MTEFYSTDMNAYRLIRRNYIDSLISSMIKLQTDSHIVSWIDKLKWCREREWDDEVRSIVRQAMNIYNERYIVIYGGADATKIAKSASA